MAAEEDVPLGDAARHYEQKFGDKVRQVQKPGARPPAGGGSGAGRGAAAGGIILAIFVVRVLFGLASSASRPAPSYPSAPAPAIDFQQLEQDMRERPEAFGPAARRLLGMEEEPSYRFEEGDLPLPEGLCYRVDREASAAGPFSPGKRVHLLLDPAARELVKRAARGERLPRVELDELRAALNELLDRQDFYSPADFLGVRLPPEVSAVRERLEGRLVPVQPEEVRKMNRLALEAAYPAQIVPARERGDAARRLAREVTAKLDLAEARRQYEPAKR